MSSGCKKQRGPLIQGEEKCPRILIVGTHFSEKSGDGTFLGRLFWAWPTDRLATVSGDALNIDWRRCQRHYRMGELRFPLRGLSRWLLSDRRLGPLSPSVSSETAAPVKQKVIQVSFIRRLTRYFWRAFVQFMGGGDVFFSATPTPRLLEWVHAFQPEVIYGHCSSLNSVRFLRKMQRSLGIPLILHIMDDWAETSYRGSWMAKLLRPCFEAEFRALMRDADVTIAICQEMAAEYEKRYQRQVLWLPMPVDLDNYQTTCRTQWTAGQPFRLRYGGRVGWAIRESLIDLAEGIQELRQEGIDVVLDLVTNETESVPDTCRALTGVTVSGLAPLADLPRLQVESDVLVVCYDFSPAAFSQARYSMPSKLADCMASGTPILVYGPAGLPVVEYARREGWGKIVDRRDPMALKSAVSELMNSASLREQLGRKARRLAVERHDAKVVAKRFRAMLPKSSV